MANIFISWSKSKSMEFAIEIKRLLESLVPYNSVFMSEESISAGEHVQAKIFEKIKQCDMLLICFTKENKKSPWLLYEAGYASGLNKKVIPILFDNNPNWHSWIDNPMNVARELNPNAKNFPSCFIDCFGLIDNSYTRWSIDNFIERIQEIKERHRQVDVQCEDFVDLLTNNSAFQVESPAYRNKTAYFLNGFETFDLWKAIVQSFLYTGKYLWIYGRKNMKLFGGNFKELFDYLEEKSMDENMSGIDFRCLFLNPESEEAKRAHSQQDIFSQELQATIMRARHQVGDNQRLKKCFRMYENRRDEIIIRIDNCIIYSRPHFDVNGYPQLMTNSKFEIFSALSDRGKECIEKFNKVWNTAIEMF